mgnify:CR=1 FL=1
MSKVLLISGTGIISGAEYVIADYLKITKLKNDFLILTSNTNNIFEFFNNCLPKKVYSTHFLSPVGAHSSRFFLILKLIYFIFSFFSFFKIIKKHKSLRVFYGNNTGDIIYSFFANVFKKKFILNVHDIIADNSFFVKLIKFFDKYVNVYIAGSNAVKISLIKNGVLEEKIHIVYTGLEPKEFYKKNFVKNSLVLGFVGLLDNRKNPLEFVSFIKELYKKNINVYGKIVYKETYESALILKKIRIEISEFNLPIELVGSIARNELDVFYKSLDFLMITSKNDPLPTVVLESMNNSIPVIGKSVDGIPEMICDSENGYLYNTIDDFTKLYLELKNLDQKKYLFLQKNALETIEKKFSNKNKIKYMNKILFDSKI